LEAAPVSTDTERPPVDDSRSDQQPDAKVTRIQGGRGWAASLPEVWNHREVLYFMVLRNLKARYRQTVLGAAWAVVQPLALVGVLVVVAERLIQIPSDGVPYPLFALAALVPWTLFSQSLTIATESVVRDLNLVSKVFVPRLILPLAAVGALLLDFLIALAILFVAMAIYSTSPGPDALLWVPLLSVLAVAVSVAVAVWLSAMMVLYRDVRAMIPVLVQIWLFATPLAYPASLLSEPWRTVFGVNPMSGIVEGFRATLLGTGPVATAMLGVSAFVTLMLLSGALVYFRRVDRIFADVI
jgi:lipopolysaccharide transport system permease protein